MVHIVSTASSFPKHYYSQEDLLTAIQEYWPARPAISKYLRRFYRNVKVSGRYLALPLEGYQKPSGFGERNDAWIKIALELGEETLCKLLDKTHLHPDKINQIAFTSTTGIAVPPIDARLMNRIPFSRNLKRMPLFGLGCVGGAAGVARLADYLQGHPDESAILLSVELCSLTIQRQDISVANMLASALFGDGAAAVLMVGSDHPLAQAGQARVVSSRSVFFPDSERIMGWDVRDTGFKIVLSAEVATVAEAGLRPALEAFLAEQDLSIQDIRYWIAHPGGPKVIQAMQTGLGLGKGALHLSRESLSAVGNISSASVLLILGETLERYQPEPGSYGVLMAMGPAFCAELVLLQW